MQFSRARNRILSVVQQLLRCSVLGFLPFGILSNVAIAAEDTSSITDNAEFWLWFSQYSDENGEVFDPLDFDAATKLAQDMNQTDDKATPNDDADYKATATSTIETKQAKQQEIAP